MNDQSHSYNMAFQNPRSLFNPAMPKLGRMNWKSKQAADKRKKAKTATAGYKNRVKARRFYPKKKFSRFAPFAPRNTTSFIIRAKKSGGIASLVSPCPVTPAILPTPKFSPLKERLVDMAKEEWGVDGYGSMKGLIFLRSPNAVCGRAAEEEGDGEGRRLDHDLSRFEIVYPSNGEEQGAAATAAAAACLLENRVDDQNTHIAQLEEESLTLKERLFLMESEMGELRRRLQLLECDYMARNENENDSNNNDNYHDEEINLNLREKKMGDCEENSGNVMLG